MEMIFIIVLMLAVIALVLSMFIDVGLKITKKDSPVVWYKPTTWLEFEVNVKKDY